MPVQRAGAMSLRAVVNRLRRGDGDRQMGSIADKVLARPGEALNELGFAIAAAASRCMTVVIGRAGSPPADEEL
jgi:hypothetical protein